MEKVNNIFQFHNGTIKSFAKIFCTYRFHFYFNSIMVRLKEFKKSDAFKLLKSYFNSIMVRLKGAFILRGS